MFKKIYIYLFIYVFIYLFPYNLWPYYFYGILQDFSMFQSMTIFSVRNLLSSSSLMDKEFEACLNRQQLFGSETMQHRTELCGL